MVIEVVSPVQDGVFAVCVDEHLAAVPFCRGGVRRTGVTKLCFYRGIVEESKADGAHLF